MKIDTQSRARRQSTFPCRTTRLPTLCKSVLALTSVLILGSSATQAENAKLVISVYGFGQDAFTEIVYKPFEEQCQCELVVETGNSVERLAKLEARKDDPEIDMAVMSTHDALSAYRKGVTTAIDVSRLSNYDKLYDIAKDPLGDHLGIGYTFYATSIVYRSDKVSIDSWQDLFKDELKGRVAFPNVTTNQGPPALYMLGKAMGDDAASLKTPIKQVAEHRDDIVTFYERSSQVAQLMQQEEILAAPIGRFAWGAYTKMDLPLAWATPKEGQTGGMNVMILTKGAKNEDLAYQFMDFWLSTDIQTKLAVALVDSPANSEVVVSDEIAGNLTYGAETVSTLKLLSPDVILDNRDGWLESWNDNVAQ